ASGPLRSVYVAVSADAALGAPTFTFTDHKVFTGSASAANIFPALAVDNFGNVYTVWSDNQNIFLSSSSDLGNTWSSPVRVNGDGTARKSNVFPWVAADAYGHVKNVGLSSRAVPDDVGAMQPTCADGTTNCWAQWSVYMAESL